MPGTKFQSSWLKKLDSTGMEAGNYIQPVSNNHFFSRCIICDSKFSTSSGFCKINDHIATKKHTSNLFKLKKTQLKLQVSEVDADKSINDEVIDLCSK